MAKLLIVDDDKISAKLLDTKLTKRGFECIYVESGSDALEILKTVDFDLVLLDIMMPDMTGTEVLKEIRKSKNNFELPVIMVTAKDETQDIVEALSQGASDYVTKPVNVDIAIARIETQLKIKELFLNSLASQQINTVHTMVTTLNHEINNPLAIAVGNLSLGVEKMDNDRLDKIMGALNRITEIVKRIEEISSGELEEVTYSDDKNMYKVK
jgi:DNA-binding response OmpR family regulator